MRILMLAGYLPYPPHSGGRIRTLELLRFLVRRHEVTLVSFTFSDAEAAHARALAREGARVVAVPWRRDALPTDSPRPFIVELYSTPEMVERLRELNAERRFDVVDAEHIWMAQYADFIDAPAVLHEHNVESEVLRRYAAAEAWPSELQAARRGWPVPSPAFRNAEAEARKVAAYEQVQWPRFAARVAVSERDRREMLRRCPQGRVVVVPNGVDTRALRPVADLDALGILFTGSLRYQPNLDALAELFHLIWPRVREQVPRARLSIVGSDPPPQLAFLTPADRAVELAADVPDLAPYAARCCVAAVPLRVGGGSRLKILAALALGLPVVATTIGREGLDLRDGEGLLVADDPEAFAEALVRVLRDRPLRSALARAGRAAVEARHDWQHLLPGFERLLEDIAADPCIGVPSWLAPHPT